MIYEMTKMKIKYPSGWCISTQVPHFLSYYPDNDKLLSFVGSDILIPDDLWKYKTVEFYKNLMVERTFIAFDELNLRTFKNNHNEPVELFCTGIKFYTCTGQILVDTLRPLSAIVKALNTLTDEYDNPKFMSIPDITLQECGKEYGLTNIPSIRCHRLFPLESFPTYSRINNILAEAEPKVRRGWINAINNYRRWVDNNIITSRASSIWSERLKSDISSSYNLNSCDVIVKSMENQIDLTDDTDILDNVPIEIMNILNYLAQHPYSDLKYTVQGYDGKLEYGFHRFIPNLSVKDPECCHLDSLIKMLLYSTLGEGHNVALTLKTNWREELELKFYFNLTLCRRIYIDSTIVGGLGTHLLASS